MCVLMWDEKQVMSLAKAEFGVTLNPQYVQQLVQELHQRGCKLDRCRVREPAYYGANTWCTRERH